MPFLAQLAALFTGDIDSVIQDAPDDATLDTLTDGIWRVSRAAHQSIGIPQDAYESTPPSANAYLNNGGILLLCTLKDIEQWYTNPRLDATTNATITLSYLSGKHPARFALFISISHRHMWFTTRYVSSHTMHIDQSTGATVSSQLSYGWNYWAMFGSMNTDSGIYPAAPVKRGVLTLTADVTASASNPLLIVPITSVNAVAPYTSGLLYGPMCARLTKTTTYSGSYSPGSVGTNTGTGSALVVTSGTFPAGTYIFEAYCATIK